MLVTVKDTKVKLMSQIHPSCPLIAESDPKDEFAPMILVYLCLINPCDSRFDSHTS